MATLETCAVNTQSKAIRSFSSNMNPVKTLSIVPSCVSSRRRRTTRRRMSYDYCLFLRWNFVFWLRRHCEPLCNKDIVSIATATAIWREICRLVGLARIRVFTTAEACDVVYSGSNVLRSSASLRVHGLHTRKHFSRGKNTMIFAVLKGWHMTPLHCVINW